jgi:DNA-binding transcriptional regulator YiaG
MSSPSKLSNVQNLSAAEKRAANDRLAMLELRAYRRETGRTVEQLAAEFAYSRDAVTRWLTGSARVPGGVIIAIRGGKVAA